MGVPPGCAPPPHPRRQGQNVELHGSTVNESDARTLTDQRKFVVDFKIADGKFKTPELKIQPSTTNSLWRKWKNSNYLKHVLYPLYVLIFGKNIVL